LSESVREGINLRLEQAHLFLILGFGILGTGIVVGSLGLFALKKSSH